MRPGAATKYLSYVVADFEQYAAEHLPQKLSDPEAADVDLLAGLRYVRTRRLTDRERELWELFTTERHGKLARAIDAACLDALVDCTTNGVATARFLAEVGTRRTPLPTSGLCEEGLRRLGAPAVEVLLTELGRCGGGVRRRRLALLLARVSRTRMPEPLRFWREAEQGDVDAALARWRALLEAKGRLPLAANGEEP